MNFYSEKLGDAIARADRLQRELEEARETADAWQNALEEIIETCGAKGPSSIACLACDGAKALRERAERLEARIQELKHS